MRVVRAAALAVDSPEFPDITSATCIYYLVAAIVMLTVKRYSTARSGLLKAARMAASIWDRSKPIASMFAMASARWPPKAKALGSL